LESLGTRCGEYRVATSHPLTSPIGKNNLPGKRFATDADVKQAVTFRLQTHDTDLFYAVIKSWSHDGKMLKY